MYSLPNISTSSVLPSVSKEQMQYRRPFMLLALVLEESAPKLRLQSIGATTAIHATTAAMAGVVGGATYGACDWAASKWRQPNSKL